MFKKKIIVTILLSVTVFGTISLAQNVDNKDIYKEKNNITKERILENEKVESIEDKDYSNKKNNLDDFLFIGDSFTVGIRDFILDNNSKVYIYAKSSTKPSYWIDKVDDMPMNDKVEGVSLLIGVNGASNPSNLTDVKELINKLLYKYPNKVIYVQKVFPVGKDFKGANPENFNKSIKKYNKGLEEFCKEKKHVEYIDTTSGYVDENGYLIKDNGDGLHIAYKYAKEFYENIENEILNRINR